MAIPSRLFKEHIAARLASPNLAIKILNMNSSSGLRDKLIEFRDAFLKVADNCRLHAQFVII